MKILHLGTVLYVFPLNIKHCFVSQLFCFQIGEQQPDDFCHDLDLPVPISVSHSNAESLSAAYLQLAAIAIDP